MKKKILTVLVALFGGLFFSGLKALAFDASEMSSTMTVSPPQQKIVLVPGEEYHGSISVHNPADSPSTLKYSVTVGSFGLGKDENGNVDYNDTDTDTVTSYNQIMDWIKLEKSSGSVEPNDGDVVPFVINVPKDAPAGGQYATLIVQNDTEGSGGEGNVMIKNVIRFAVSIIAEVAGETRDEGAILENSVPSIFFASPLTAGSIVRNNGNVHTDAEYTLQVWPLFSDEELCTNEEKPETSLIIPDTERYHAQICNTPVLGIFRVKQIVKIFGETSIVEKTVLVCPLWLMFIVILAIVFMVFWLFAKRRGRREGGE